VKTVQTVPAESVIAGMKRYLSSDFHIVLDDSEVDFVRSLLNTNEDGSVSVEEFSAFWETISPNFSLLSKLTLLFKSQFSIHFLSFLNSFFKLN
jgi:hypothetical protein